MADDIIYHYCSLDSFVKIVETKRIWLTNLFFMNDAQEHYWLRRIAVKVIDKMVKEGGDFDREFARELKRSFGARDTFIDLYCACFSRQPDSLGQWRAYANDGCGVAVGFSREYLSQSEFQLEGPSFSVNNVLYCGSEQERVVREIVGRRVKEIGKTSAGVTPQLARKFCQARTFTDIWPEAARCKNPKFREEKEVRVVYWPNVLYDHSRLLCGPKYRAKANTIVPYYEMVIDPHLKFEDAPQGLEPIREVMFGPKCEHIRTEPVARHLLKQNGFDVTKIAFTKSKASYQ